MAKRTKKMTTGKKVAIGVGVAAVVGAILCYFYCPCFKKKDETQDTDSYAGQGPTSYGGGMAVPSTTTDPAVLTSFTQHSKSPSLYSGTPERLVDVF